MRWLICTIWVFTLAKNCSCTRRVRYLMMCKLKVQNTLLLGASLRKYLMSTVSQLRKSLKRTWPLRHWLRVWRIHLPSIIGPGRRHLPLVSRLSEVIRFWCTRRCSPTLTLKKLSLKNSKAQSRPTNPNPVASKSGSLNQKTTKQSTNLDQLCFLNKCLRSKNNSEYRWKSNTSRSWTFISNY